MAQVTQLQPNALPGQVRTFVAKIAARATVTTMFAALVGLVPTKYRIRVRQREGMPTLGTVEGICQLRATLHARSNLLPNDTTIVPSDDSFLDQAGPNVNRTTLGSMNFSHIQPISESKPIMSFDVSALEGFIWKTAVLKLTFDVAGGSTPPFPPTLLRVKRTLEWGSGLQDPPTWNIYAGGPSPAGSSWQVPGAGGVNDADGPGAISWTDYPSQPYTIGQQIISPDITTLINDANKFNDGTLVMLLRGGVPAFTTQKFVSINGAAGETRPHLFIDAF